ncbi:MAG: cytochrome c [Actinomycetota bacterium]|nr:cytochrome c [Actinomycetota bacterium]
MSRAAILAAAAAIVAAAAAVVGWQTEPSESAAPKPVAVSGAELFQSKGCASCHIGPDSTPLVGAFPPLDDAASWAAERRPGMSARDYLAESMRTPSAFLSPAWVSGGPTTAMPDLGLTEAEIDALVDHLLQG